MLKVLLLHHGGDFTAPLLRSVEAFREHGIDLATRQLTDGPWYLRVSELAAAQPGSHDVVILEEPPIQPAMLECMEDTPVILLERIDGAQLRTARWYLSKSRVLGVIKGYAFRDRSLYNRTNDRRHVEILHEAGVQCEKPRHLDALPQPQLSDADLAKIRVGYSMFGCHANLRPLIDAAIDFDAERPIDVHFAGTVTYGGSEIETHRRLALEAVKSWPGTKVASEGLAIPKDEYLAQLQQSKCVVCPWGWGEGTHREYEAMLAGAVVIKPYAHYVEGNIEGPYATSSYVSCAVDFSDLHVVLKRTCDLWGGHQKWRGDVRVAAVSAWQPESIAARMSTQIKELISV